MIKRLRVKGFKSLYDLDVTFSPLTVLFGANTSGKSNVLDVIQLLARSVTAEHIADIFDAPFRGSLLSCFSLGDGGHVPENAKIEITVDLSVSFASGTSDVSYKQVRYELVLGYAPERFPCVLHESLYDISEKSLLPLWTGYEDSTLLSEFKSVSHLQGSSLGDMSLPLAVAQEIKSWQVFSLDPQDGLRAINEELRPDANLGPKGEKLASFLYTLKMRNPAQWETFQKALHLYIPEITAVEILLNQHNELELFVIENDKRISIRLMSDGTLALLGLLAIGSAKKHHGVIAIEEIETGIDPQKLDWVARYLEMQADVDRQFIVTTHSPHLLDFLSIESLYLCKKKNGKTSVVPVSTLPLIQKLDPEESLSDVILSGELHV